MKGCGKTLVSQDLLFSMAFLGTRNGRKVSSEPRDSKFYVIDLRRSYPSLYFINALIFLTAHYKYANLSLGDHLRAFLLTLSILITLFRRGLSSVAGTGCPHQAAPWGCLPGTAGPEDT